MTAMERLQQAAETKHQDNVVLFRAYVTTLSALTPANFLLVVGAALLSLVAGASLLTKNGVLSSETAGILALLSSAFTIIHTKIGCEQYQGQCEQLKSFHRGIAEEYADLRTVDDVDALRERLSALNEELAKRMKGSPHLPFKWAVTRATKKSHDA